MPSLLKPRFLPRISSANIDILQTNAQFVDIFSSFYSFVVQFAFHSGQDTRKERVPTSLIPLVGSGKPYQKMKKSSPRPIVIRCGHLPPFVP